jgi:hypothetical protein
VGNGEWGTGSGEWGVESGEWGEGSGEWGVGNGEWGVGNGEWGMENGEWGVENGEWGVVVRGLRVKVPRFHCSWTMRESITPQSPRPNLRASAPPCEALFFTAPTLGECCAAISGQEGSAEADKPCRVCLRSPLRGLSGFSQEALRAMSLGPGRLLPAFGEAARPGCGAVTTLFVWPVLLF